MSIYRPIGKPDVTNERMTHLLKLDTFFHTHDARIMTHDASRIRTTHRVDLALEMWIVLENAGIRENIFVKFKKNVQKFW